MCKWLNGVLEIVRQILSLCFVSPFQNLLQIMMQALFLWVSKNLCAISIWKIRPRKWTSILSVLASMETLLSEYYYWIFKEFSHICEMDMLLNLMYWYFYFLFSLVERNKCIVVSIPDPSFMSRFDFMPIEHVSLVGSALPALFLELEIKFCI